MSWLEAEAECHRQGKQLMEPMDCMAYIPFLKKGAVNIDKYGLPNMGDVIYLGASKEAEVSWYVWLVVLLWEKFVNVDIAYYKFSSLMKRQKDWNKIALLLLIISKCIFIFSCIIKMSLLSDLNLLLKGWSLKWLLLSSFFDFWYKKETYFQT